MTRVLGSAAYRIAIATSAAFTLSTIVLGVAVYLTAHGLFVRQLEGEVASDSSALVAEFDEGGSRELAYAIAERERGNTANELVYAVFDTSGRRVGGSMDAVMPALGWSDIVFRDPREGPDPARALAVELHDGNRLVVAADWSAIDKIDRTIIVLFCIAFAVEALFGIAGALLLGGYLRRRLSAISDAAEAIVAGDLAQRVAVGLGNDEFDRLARTLNGMLDRIEGLMSNLRRVSGDVAHDLRTPLARLRQGLEESLLAGPVGVDRQAVIEDAVTRLDEILRLFAAILRISEVEGGRAMRGFAPVDLGALVTELCESYAPAAEESGRSLAWSVQQDIVLDGDRELLAQAVINLLDNALIHTPEGTMVKVVLAQEADGVSLSVSDNGPGVREADHEFILQRFARLEGSRSTPGHGLGLNLVQAIAKAHGATISVEDNAPGLRIVLRFGPARKAEVRLH